MKRKIKLTKEINFVESKDFINFHDISSYVQQAKKCGKYEDACRIEGEYNVKEPNFSKKNFIANLHAVAKNNRFDKTMYRIQETHTPLTLMNSKDSFMDGSFGIWDVEINHKTYCYDEFLMYVANIEIMVLAEIAWQIQHGYDYDNQYLQEMNFNDISLILYKRHHYVNLNNIRSDFYQNELESIKSRSLRDERLITREEYQERDSDIRFNRENIEYILCNLLKLRAVSIFIGDTPLERIDFLETGKEGDEEKLANIYIKYNFTDKSLKDCGKKIDKRYLQKYCIGTMRITGEKDI